MTEEVYQYTVHDTGFKIKTTTDFLDYLRRRRNKKKVTNLLVCKKYSKIEKRREGGGEKDWRSGCEVVITAVSAVRAC